VLHRHALAGFRRRGARRRDRVVPRARAPLRPHQRPGRGGEAARSRLNHRARLQGHLAVRVATATVLIAALLAAPFLLPRAWLAVLAGALVLGAGLEWARLCKLGPDGSWTYAVALTITFAALYNTRPEAPTFALAALFWIVVAPFWLWRGATS